MFIEVTCLDGKPRLINADCITLIVPSNYDVYPNALEHLKECGIPVEVVYRYKEDDRVIVNGVYVEYQAPDENNTLRIVTPTYEELKTILLEGRR